MLSDNPVVPKSINYDLSLIVSYFWEKKIIVMLSAGLVTLLFLLIYLFIPVKYSAEAVLTKSSQGTTSTISNLPGQLGGLASLAGIGLGDGDSTDVNIALEVLKSWGFIETFIIKYELEKNLIAVETWDRSSDLIIYDTDIYNEKSNSWVLDKTHKARSSWNLYKSFSDTLNIMKDKHNGFIYLTIQHESAKEAKLWVELLVFEINEYMRKKAIAEAKRNIEYLKEELKNIENKNIKSLIFNIVEEQTKKLMIAETNPNFVFSVISSPKVAEIKSSISGTVFVGFGVFLGLIIGSFIVVVKFMLVKVRNDRR